MIAPVTEYNTQAIEDAISATQRNFPDDIEYIRYSIRDDWAGEPALFFRVLLKDRSYPKPFVLADPRFAEIVDLCNQIRSEIRSLVRASGLDLYTHSSFRLASEQLELRDPEWD
jgi:hypothetical protein